MLFSPFGPRCKSSSPQPVTGETDVPVRRLRGQAGRVPPLHHNLGGYISAFNSPSTPVWVRRVCRVQGEKTREAGVTSARVCQRDEEIHLARVWESRPWRGWRGGFMSWIFRTDCISKLQLWRCAWSCKSRVWKGRRRTSRGSRWRELNVKVRHRQI